MYTENRQGKRITVYINGDRFMTGQVVTVNTHDFPVLERFCSFLTRRIPHPTGGCYRRLYTTSGTEVQGLEQIESGNEYVASKDRLYRQPAKDLRYAEIKDDRRREYRKNAVSDQKTYTPVSHQHDPRLRNLEGRAREMGRRCTAVRLKIHMNGDYTSESIPITIKDAKSKSLGEIMNIIQDTLRSQQLSRLYKVVNDGGSLQNFHQLTENDIPQLENGDHIVALEKTPYKLAPKTYHKRNNFDTSASPRHNRSLTPPRRKQFSKHKPLPSIGSSNQSQNDTMSPFSNAPSHGGRKSNKSKGSRNQRDYDTDEGGVFKAKKQNNAQGAHQVNDSRETRTEKPIDQREAEVVDEEEIHSKEKTTPIPPGTELNKRPSKETKQNSDNGTQSKTKIEVKKGGKSNKEVINKLSVLPPIIDEGVDKSSSEKADNVKKGDKKDIKDGKVKDAVDKIEGKNKEGVEGRKKTNDHETNDVIEMSERQEGTTPMELLSNDARISNPPLSTTPPNGQLSPTKSLKKERVNEDAAAAKIQAGARAYKARKEYKAKKEAKRQDDDDRRRRQQEEEADRFEEEARRKAEDNSKQKQLDEDKAATKIQASFKGHKARKDFKERQAAKQQVCHDKQSKNEKEIEAATKIQSGFRGYKARKDYNHRKKQAKITDINDNEKKADNKVGKTKMNQDDAAVVIQAGYKGYKTRKDFAQRKAQEKNEKIEAKVDNNTDNDKEQMNAATKIQANFRGYKARKDYSNRKQKAREDKARVEKESATKIQASFKGFKARKEIAEKKKNEPQLPDQSPSPKANDADLDKAASKIQAGFKGYKARKEYNAKVNEENIVETDVAQLPESAVTRSSFKKGQFIQENAASKIQSAFRVYHAKKVLEAGGEIYGKGEIGFNSEAEENVRAVFKGYKARQFIKQNQRKISAAKTVRASYKGYRVRQTKFYPKNSLNKFHAAVRGYITRKLNSVKGATLSSNEKVLSVVNGDYYANIVQALCKGFLTRYTVRLENEKLKSKPTSAKSLQGPTEEPVPQESDNEVTYWQDTNIKMYSDKTIRKAAARIQSAIYSYKTRKQFEHRRTGRLKNIKGSKTDKEYLNGNAISNVKSCFKGYVVRKSAQNGRGMCEVGQNDDKVVAEFNNERKDNLNEDKKKLNESVRDMHISDQNQSPTIPSRPSSSKFEKGNDRLSTGQKRPRSGRPCSGRPRSSRPASGRPRSGKSPHSGKLSLKSADMKHERKGSELAEIDFKEVTPRSSTKLSGTGHSVISETTLDLSDIKQGKSQGSAKSYSTAEMSEISKTSGGEIEKEGDSYREVEDDAGELSSIEKNVNAVGHLQAAFRAYRMRREISELLSGGGELMDITKIDRAVSALRKDFRLRSAKVRRLGSYQFGSEKLEKRAKSSQNWWEGTGGDEEGVHDQEYDDVMERNVGINSMRDSERSESVVKIKAAMKGYTVRRDMKERESNQLEARKTIEAAYRGYRTRLTEDRISSSYGSRASSVRSAGSKASDRSARTVFHVQMHSDVINKKCTILQAAFAAYQTRKVFMSLSKLVEGNGESDSDTSGQQLERMGSLSETDDFKLRHKSIAKIQAAYESHRIAHESRKNSKQYSSVLSGSLNKHMVLPPIQSSVQVQHVASRPKSGVINILRPLSHVSNRKAKTQPDLFSRYRNASRHKSLNHIETYIQKKLAATTIQSYAQAYLTRQRNKLKKKKAGSKTSVSIGRKTPVSVSSKSSKLSKDSKESKDCLNRSREDKTMTDMVRVRTASIKLEAERRKVIAEKIRLKQQAEAKSRVGKSTKVDNVIKNKEEGHADSLGDLTPIPSSRLSSDRSEKANELVVRENQAAVKIQKVYRGHRTRRQNETKKQLENEYEDWAKKRNGAAVVIQSTWRGYSVRKDRLSEKESEGESVDKNVSTDDDFSHLYNRGVLVINIGRTKSEIERANRLYDNCSMIQMVFRACKVRRDFAVKAAKSRRERNKASTKIQALYLAFTTRHEFKQSVSATRIQGIVKAFLARDNMRERQRLQAEEEAKASSLIQAAYLSFGKRRENEAMKKERRLTEAADAIKIGSKGFLARWENARKWEQRRSEASKHIQFSFFGHKEREKTKKRREASSAIMASFKGHKLRQEIKVTRAVTTIIAGFKSHKDRQEAQKLKDKQRRERSAASRLQAAYKASLVRKWDRQNKEKMAREHKAASSVQKLFRGFVARRAFEKERIRKEKLRESSAVKIQSVYRGFKGREIARQKANIRDMHNIAEAMVNLIVGRTFEYIEKRSNSSERIQATVKGYRTRSDMLNKLTDEAKQRMSDGSLIQAAFRADKDRKLTDKAIKRRKSASLIQACYRGYRYRKVTNKVTRRGINATLIQAVFRAKHIRKIQDNRRQLKLMNDSATKIQAIYRGYRCRSDIEKEREMIANIEPPPSAMISARTRSGKLLSISMDEVLMKNSKAIILFHRKATELQAAFNAYRTRTEMKDRLVRKTTVAKQTPRRVLSVTKRLTKEDLAAILIQKTFRGYWYRKIYKNAILQRRKLRENAATNLQAAVKGCRVRVEERVKILRLEKEGLGEVWRKKQEAANIISFAFRSYHHRKEKKELRFEM